MNTEERIVTLLFNIQMTVIVSASRNLQMTQVRHRCEQVTPVMRISFLSYGAWSIAHFVERIMQLLLTTIVLCTCRRSVGVVGHVRMLMQVVIASSVIWSLFATTEEMFDFRIRLF